MQWEGVLMLQRLIIALVAVFIMEPLWRAWAVVAMMLPMLGIHLLVQPFWKRSSNVFLAGCYASLLAIGSWEVGQAVYRDYGWELPEDTSQQFSIIVGILTLSPFCVGCAFAMHAQFGSRMFGTWSVGRLFTAPKTVEFSCDLTELDGWEPAPSQEGGTQDDSLVVC